MKYPLRSTMPQEGLEVIALSRAKTNLTDSQRRAIYETLLQWTKDGKLPKGCISEVAAKFSVSTKTVSRIWQRGRESIESELSAADASLRKKGRSGGRKKALDFSRIADIPLRKRSSIRSLASALDIPKSTLHARIKEDRKSVV